MKVKCQVSLVFHDWLGPDGESVYQTDKGVELSMGDFHSGSTFPATITLDVEDAMELAEALAKQYSPVFWLAERKEKP